MSAGRVAIFELATHLVGCCIRQPLFGWYLPPTLVHRITCRVHTHSLGFPLPCVRRMFDILVSGRATGIWQWRVARRCFWSFQTGLATSRCWARAMQPQPCLDVAQSGKSPMVWDGSNVGLFPSRASLTAPGLMPTRPSKAQTKSPIVHDSQQIIWTVFPFQCLTKAMISDCCLRSADWCNVWRRPPLLPGPTRGR